MKTPSWIAGAWWQATLRPPAPTVAWAGAGLLGISATGCGHWLAESMIRTNSGKAHVEQEENGWNVGSADEPLLFPGEQETDAAGSVAWHDELPNLAARLAPPSPRWQPYYAPALFQSLQAPRNEDLRAALRPIMTPAMGVAARRGEAMLSLFLDEHGACRRDTALVLDLSGPESVAVAAALAPCFEPIFFFDNWPHAQGVVPSHLTLGAALYNLPLFESFRTGRAAGAPPAFVLDRQRLNPYGDDADQFDNRYLARLPSPGTLAAGGVRHVIYVTPDDIITHELDDLNDDLVAIDQIGLRVRMLALTDFQPDGSDPTRALADTDADADGDTDAGGGEPVVDEPVPTFYFGGSLSRHRCFWCWYGWAPGAGGEPMPPRFGARCNFHPAPRATFAFGWRGSPPGQHGRSAFSASPMRGGSWGRVHFGHMS